MKKPEVIESRLIYPTVLKVTVANPEEVDGVFGGFYLLTYSEDDYNEVTTVPIASINSNERTFYVANLTINTIHSFVVQGTLVDYMDRSEFSEVLTVNTSNQNLPENWSMEMDYYNFSNYLAGMFLYISFTYYVLVQNVFGIQCYQECTDLARIFIMLYNKDVSGIIGLVWTMKNIILSPFFLPLLILSGIVA